MKKVLFTGIVTGLMLLAACSNGDVKSEGELIEDTEDLQTLIDTNEFLVQQLTKVREENEQLKNTVDLLKEENNSLKDDILTFNQQIYEFEDVKAEEKRIRNELDIMAKELFQAMNVSNHVKIANMSENNITVNSESETLEIGDPDANEMTYTFHYINLDSINYVRQVDFNYNREQGIFTSKYSLSSEGGKDTYFEGEVILTFTYNNKWKLSTIRYNR